MSAFKHISRWTVLLPVAIALVAVIASCSPNKNTAASRRYQAFITRYNIYYNGNKHFVETLEDMENKYEDDYSQLLYMHPAEARANQQAPQPTGDFTRSIEKGQKAIQLRSIRKRPKRKGGRLTPEQKAFYTREEYNPFIHNAWLMMARSQFYNGDFAGSASTFFYISKHFTWLPEVVTEAEIWQARSYVCMDWLFEAEVILNRIKDNQLEGHKHLQELADFTRADLLLHRRDYEGALPYLQRSAQAAHGSQRSRLNFLLGQVYARLGRNQEAYEAYRRAGSSPSTPYRTKFNARIHQSEVYMGEDITPEVKALRRMLRYDRNKEYRDQIYYAIGNLYLSRGDTTQAIENYVLAVENSTRNGIDKAIAQITLGELYFAQRRYNLAQPCYAEAIGQLPDDYPNIALLKRRSDVLDQLSVYSENVQLQDSLLHLSTLTREEQMVIINKIIEDLNQKEREEAEAARRAEHLANAEASQAQQQGSSSAPAQFNINTDNSWYFYNTATKNAGKTEFQRKWGARRLEDNWRRRNKQQFNTDDFDAPADGESTDEETATAEEAPTDSATEASERASDPHYPEYYLAQIPTTDEQRQTAHQVIQEGLYNMGVILKDRLEDFDASAAQFTRLLNDYPDNEYRLDTYYNMYLMYVRQNRTADAEVYRQLILDNFADSPIGMALRDPNYIENLRQMDSRQRELYDATYQAYMANDNQTVHDNYAIMQERYPLSKIMPKFMFLHALAYVTEHRTDDFNAVLRELLERYPDTDITPIASAWLKGMASGRELQSGGENMRGMIWDMRLTNDSTVTAEGEANFVLDDSQRQVLVMTFATDSVSSNGLLYLIARHNFRSFVVKDFDLEQLNFGRLGMIIIKPFENLNELRHYCRVAASDPEFRLPTGVRPIVISEANFKILLDQGRSFEEYFRFLQQQNFEFEEYREFEYEELEPEEPEQQPVSPAEEQPAEQQPVEQPVAPAEEQQPVEQPVQPTEQPTQPAQQPSQQPSQQPAAQPRPAQPSQQPAQQPAVQPQTPAPTPQQPSPILQGSEGEDDPLLNNLP